jgi:phage terminase large subunit-like protein
MPAGAEKFGAWFDEDAARRACAFFPAMLRHTEGEWAGKPFHLMDWQRDTLIRPLFGWKRADGTRLFRRAWIEIPRKNGKTEIAAGISLLLMFIDREMGGQGYSMAVDKDQAKIVFNKAATMAAMNPGLSNRLELLKGAIYCPALNASFKPLSAGPQGKHGLSPTFAIGDEVHEWRDGELADVVHKGTAARRQPLEIYITTAGIKGVGYAAEQHDLALEILAGDVIDPTILVVIFAANENDDWTKEETWRKANPNYGISVKPDYMREEAEKAARSPRAENDFRRFHLNQWTEQITRWIPVTDWKASAGSIDWKDLPAYVAGRRCFGAIDLSQARDWSALCWCFPPPDDQPEGEYIFTWRFWLPDQSLFNEPAGRRARYQSYVDAGALTLMPGNIVDNEYIRAQVNADAEIYNPEWIGIDPFNMGDMPNRMRDTDGLPIEFFRQGYLSMSPASKGFERLVLGHKMQHGNHPVASWMARNISVTTDPAGNIKPDKSAETGAAGKIDGIVAAIMAYGGATLKPPERPVGVQNVNGILIIG